MLTSRAARMAQATRIRTFHSSPSSMRGIFANRWVYRENRVPYYQRLMQKDDGKRLWWKSHRSAYILYPYYIMLYGSLTATMYAMCRMVLGHKTWY